MTVKEQIDFINGLMDQQHSIYDYLNCVWLPGLYKYEMDHVFQIEEDQYVQSVEDVLYRLNLKNVGIPEQ